MKSKEKQIQILQKEMGTQIGQLMQTTLEKESIESRLENLREIEQEVTSVKCHLSKIPVLKRLHNNNSKVEKKEDCQEAPLKILDSRGKSEISILVSSPSRRSSSPGDPFDEDESDFHRNSKDEEIAAT